VSGREIPFPRSSCHVSAQNDLVTDHLHDQLQRSLGTAYKLERELGGGGMSRVYVPEEIAFGRRVVVKLLSPELAAG
jgi:serine/threonine protein kinase